MKKLICIVLVATLAITSVMPFVKAEEAEELQQDDVEIDEKTQNETRIIEYPYGAEIRLLQLEKILLKSIIKGEIVILILRNISVDTTELEVILDEMKILLDEVNVSLEKVKSADLNSKNATQEFVDLKYDAIELVRDFREELHKLVSDEVLDEIRERIREATCEQAENLATRIRNRIRVFNRNQLHRLYQIIGETNLSILNDYLNDNVTIDEVKIQISKLINQFTKEKRNRIFDELRESNIKAHIQSIEHIEYAKKGFHERRQNRLNKRLNAIENSQNIDVHVQTQLQNRLRNEIEREKRNKGGKL